MGAPPQYVPEGQMSPRYAPPQHAPVPQYAPVQQRVPVQQPRVHFTPVPTYAPQPQVQQPIKVGGMVYQPQPQAVLPQPTAPVIMAPPRQRMGMLVFEEEKYCGNRSCGVTIALLFLFPPAVLGVCCCPCDSRSIQRTM